MANLTLARRDSYLSHVKSGIKLDTLAALRTAPLQLAMLFPDEVLKRAEDDILNFESKGHSSSQEKKLVSTPTLARICVQRVRSRINQHGKTVGVMAKARDRETGPPISLHLRPRGSSPINDNYCLNVLEAGLLPRSKQTVNLYQLPQSPSVIRKAMNIRTRDSLSEDLSVINHVPIAKGLSQNESSVVVTCCKEKLNDMKDVSSVDQLSVVKHATNVPAVVSNLPVGARLQNFWKAWEDLGAGLKVVQIIKEGNTLPFWIRLNLARSPTIISCYINPHRNLYLLEALHQLISKNAV